MRGTGHYSEPEGAASRALGSLDYSPLPSPTGVIGSEYRSRALDFKTLNRPPMADADRLSAKPMETGDFPAAFNWRSRRSSSSVHFVLLLRAIKTSSPVRKLSRRKRTRFFQNPTFEMPPLDWSCSNFKPNREVPQRYGFIQRDQSLFCSSAGGLHLLTMPTLLSDPNRNICAE